jgi:peptidoglycan/LPS O-acetylase OafA/YrhL
MIRFLEMFRMHSLPPTKEKFRNDIQGLRAIAVLSVVLFHAWPGLLPGGFLGVDIFFVISGFLIGGIIFRELLEDKFVLLDFYRKRVRRIFPALFTTLILTIFAGWIILGPDDLEELARNSISSALFVSNVDFFLYSGYFDTQAELRPLLHTWSLSVEEQFYIFFPLILALCLRYFKDYIITIVVISIFIFLWLSQWAISVSATGAYFLFPFRVFEFLIGTLAAYVKPPIFRSQKTAIVGLFLIIISLASIDSNLPFPGLLALPATTGTALILWAGRFERGGGGGLVAQILSVRPMIFFGAISYSLYLSHWPILAFVRILNGNHPSAYLVSICIAAAIVIGWVNWRLVEQRYAHASLKSPILSIGVASMAFVCLVALTVWLQNGFPQRLSQENLALFGASQDYSPYRTSCHQQDNERLLYAQTCKLGGVSSDKVEVVVWADSHGAELAAALSNLYVVRQVTASACPPTIGVSFPIRPNCKVANEEILSGIKADPDNPVIILLINREAYPEIPWAELILGFERAEAALRSAGKSVIVVKQIPNPNLNAPQVAGMNFRWGFNSDYMVQDRSATNALNSPWQSFYDRFDGGIFDPMDILCNSQACPIMIGGEVMYFNETHISMSAANLIAQNEMFKSLVSGGR